ncbi:MAG: phospholipase D family protein [Victivallales bacterium]
MLRIHDGKWNKEFLEAFKNTRNSLKIITPFIQLDTITRLLGKKKPQIQLITRFNLNDFYSGVSSLAALEYLLNKKGASIQGIKRLHSKVYIFDNNKAFLTSANLTGAALNGNVEYGIILEDEPLISQCHKYFDTLWLKGKQLSMQNISDWKQKIALKKAKTSGQPREDDDLGDYGGDYSFVEQNDVSSLPSTDIPCPYSEQAFIKFAGTGRERQPVHNRIIDEIVGTGDPVRCFYPHNKAPRKVKSGDLIFFGMITADSDIHIYGYGFAIAHDYMNDIVTSELEIKHCPWKRHFSRYVEIRDYRFINGEFADGVSLKKLKKALGSDLFYNTKKNKILGIGNKNPDRAYLRKSDVMLSEDGRSELYKRVEKAIADKGLLSKDDIQKAYENNNG